MTLAFFTGTGFLTWLAIEFDPVFIIPAFAFIGLSLLMLVVAAQDRDR